MKLGFLTHENPMGAEAYNIHSRQQQGHHYPLDNQPNPLLSMLSNLGMNVGINSPGNTLSNNGSLPQQLPILSHGIGLNMQQSLPQGVNVISAEELEERLRSSEDNTRFIETHAQNYPPNNSSRSLHGGAANNMSGLINPPPGFTQPKPESVVGNLPSNIITPPIFPPFGLVGTPSTVISPSAFHAQPHAHERIFRPSTNIAARFPLSEEHHNNLVTVGNNSTGNLIHSSPFGLGLSIGGLGHMLGRQPINPPHPTSREGLSSNPTDSGLSFWNHFPTNAQTPGANIDTNPNINSPNSSSISSSFSFPLNNLFNLPPTDLPAHPTGENSHSASLSTPWPPK